MNRISEEQRNEPCLETDMAFSISEAQERIALLQEFIRTIMKEGVDFGVLPNTDKRCLFKSGAEKLCDIFGFAKKLEITNRIEDFEQGIFHYEVKAILIQKKTGVIEAEGIGSCNNREKKYRNQDACNLVNTILKMAKKRAFVDAVLSATRSSDLFTQDQEVEEESVQRKINDNGNGTPQKAAIASTSSGKDAKSNKGVTGNSDGGTATKRQISFVFTLFSQKQITMECARELMDNRYAVDEVKQLTKEQASDFIAYLREWQG